MTKVMDQSHFALLFLIGCFILDQPVAGQTVLDSVVQQSTTWRTIHSPYLAKSDVLIPKELSVTVEPGVTVMFNPGFTLKVKGTLIARGTAAQRITFTKNTVKFPAQGTKVVPERLRLVDGSEIREGHLHILYRGRWRPVCSQNREWSRTDSKLTCQELGFLEGNFTLLQRAENYTHHMLYQAPRCKGDEASILDCPGRANISVGSDICNLQELVGLNCWGANPASYPGHWKGIELFNSTVRVTTLDTANTKLNISASMLEYVDILYAGVNTSQHNTAALSGSPHAPVLKHVRVAYSAYDGVNFTDLTGPAILQNTMVEWNRGHGINISSAMGYVRVDGLTASRNGGDGGVVHLLDYHWPDEATELVHKARYLCRHGSIPHSPVFPFMVVAENINSQLGSDTCEMVISTPHPNQIITVSLLEVIRDPNAQGRVRIIDKWTGETLADWYFKETMVMNPDGSYRRPKRYHGVSSVRNEITIRYDWQKLPNQKTCPIFAPCLRAIMMLSVGQSMLPEVRFTTSNFLNNTQRGLTINNPWTYVEVLNSRFQGNLHDAGLKIFNGSADILVNASHFVENERCGLNISTADGFRIVNASQFLRNRGYGLDVWNPTWLTSRDVSLTGKPITSHVYMSHFEENQWAGMRFYNSCFPMNVLVNFTKVIRSGHSGIEMYSCLSAAPLGQTNFTVGFSEFVANRWHAIEVQPMGNMMGYVVNSTFTQHTRGAIYIENTDNFIKMRLYKPLKVDYQILFNTFRDNSGPFVINVRLTQGSSKQKMQILYNRFQLNSVHRDGAHLNPRSSAHAVVLISSSNVVFVRNSLRNPGSYKEIATHLAASDQTINATLNFWGTQTDWGGIGWGALHQKIFSRIFGQIDRYTLAKIDYIPVLKENNLRTLFNTVEEPAYTHEFRAGNSLTIGGRINLERFPTVNLEKANYRVTRDIFVPLGAILNIKAGARLEFENSVGMFVQGIVNIVGTEAEPIELTVRQTPIIAGNSTQIRLSGVSGVDWQGLVEVKVNGEWGTICERGFDPIVARIVCNALGLVAHPIDWLPPVSERIRGRPNQKIVMASVRCQDWDQTLTDCEFDTVGDHSCTHDTDANVRCHEAGWAGVRTTLTEQKSRFLNVKVTNAGLLDYYYMLYSPGIQIDFNSHEINNVHISNSLSDGLAIFHNNIWLNLQITGGIFSNNLGSGLVTRSPWLRVEGSTMSNNQQAGLRYDSSFTAEEAFQLRAGMIKTLNLVDPSVAPDAGGVVRNSLSVHPTGTEFVVMEAGTSDEQRTYLTELYSTDPAKKQQLVITVLDFYPNSAIENVSIYDTAMNQVTSDRQPGWMVPRDMLLFPIRSTGTVVTVKVVVNGTRSGRLTLAVQSRIFTDTAASTDEWSGRYYPPTYLNVTACNLDNNLDGIVIKHYNDPADRDENIFLRHRREVVKLERLNVRRNRRYALHVPSVSRFANDWFAPAYSEIIEGSSRTAHINYEITSCTFEDNEVGMFSEHNHVEFSNNVWNYLVKDNTFVRSKSGGVRIFLPFVSKKFDWRYLPDTDHRLNFTNNGFEDNTQFIFEVSGYHAQLAISKNRFLRNTCGTGLIVLAGMEKRLDFSDNRIEGNRDCHFLLELDITSQSEQAVGEPALITRNVVRGNQCPATVTYSAAMTTASLQCYAVGLFGSQNATVTRNIFSNKGSAGFQHELIAGILSVNLGNYMDCRENYWGSTNINEIRALIFDFDDWNNFARASFERFLLDENLSTANIYQGLIPEVQMDVNKAFGGRLIENKRLISRREPYVITSDLTVMPGVTLTVEAGTTLQFGPNVGLLVLGRLIAQGTQTRPIKLESLPVTQTSARLKRLADPPSIGYSSGQITLHKNGIRLIGGLNANEGFVQFLNTTAGRWDLACDDQFSEQVGQVVCRELGVETYNIVVRPTYLYDHYIYGYDNPFVTKHIWMTRYTCKGAELDRTKCTRRLNYDAFRCHLRRDFVFLRCGASNLAKGQRYWGNVRIASARLEQSISLPLDQSILEHVHITGAGVLHRQRVAAIETTYMYPSFAYISISNCAWNGLDLVAPRGFIHTTNSTFDGNLGYGYGMTILNGDSTNTNRGSNDLSKFIPLIDSTLPYHMLGMLDMCDTTKDFVVIDRLLVYYKYSYQTRACTKMFRSAIAGKQVGLRFLQLNLYHDPFTKNTIELFNGDAFNITELITEISALNTATPDERRRSYMTSILYDIMGVHVHASAARESHGFIAEVVTLPLSPDKAYPDRTKVMEHRMQDCEFFRNQQGAVSYAGVGELNPDLSIYYNRFQYNGLGILNLTSAPTISIRMQNAVALDVSNNYIHRNKGGMDIWLHALGKATMTNVTNNVIVRTTHGGALWMSGNLDNMLKVERNFIANNDCEMRDVVRVSGVLMKPFAHNYLYKNLGAVTLNASGEEKLSTASEYLWNGFYMNQAINYTRRTTVFCDSSKHNFAMNYFRNMQNDYELAMGNQSIIKKSNLEPGTRCPYPNRDCPSGWTQRLELNACICYRKDTLNATMNWWGENSEYYIRGRVWDGLDDEYLIKVDWSSPVKDNRTVLDGSVYCPPTWAYHGSTCFWYLGGAVNQAEAKTFCQDEANGILAFSRDRIQWLTNTMASWQNNYPWINRYTWNSRTWIFSEVPFPGQCPVVRNGWLEPFHCATRIQFFCQKSPEGAYANVQPEVVIAVGTVVALLVLGAILLIIFWVCKSKRRDKERLVRRQSLQRMSVMGSRAGSVRSAKSATVLSTVGPLHSPTGPGSVLSSGGRSTDYMVGRPAGRHTLADSRETLDRSKVDEVPARVPSRTTLASTGKPPTSTYAPAFYAPSSRGDRAPSQSSLDQLDAPRQLAESEIPRLRPTNAAGAGVGVAMRDMPTHAAPVRNKPVLTRPMRSQDTGPPPPYSVNPYPEEEDTTSSLAKKSAFSDTFSDTDTFDETDFEDTPSVLGSGMEKPAGQFFPSGQHYQPPRGSAPRVPSQPPPSATFRPHLPAPLPPSMRPSGPGRESPSGTMPLRGAETDI